MIVAIKRWNEREKELSRNPSKRGQTSDEDTNTRIKHENRQPGFLGMRSIATSLYTRIRMRRKRIGPQSTRNSTPTPRRLSALFRKRNVIGLALCKRIFCGRKSFPYHTASLARVFLLNPPPACIRRLARGDSRVSPQGSNASNAIRRQGAFLAYDRK
jgi:hypothetical protein